MKNNTVDKKDIKMQIKADFQKNAAKSKRDAKIH